MTYIYIYTSVCLECHGSQESKPAEGWSGSFRFIVGWCNTSTWCSQPPERGWMGEASNVPKPSHPISIEDNHAQNSGKKLHIICGLVIVVNKSLSIYLSVYLSVCLSVYRSVYLSVYLSIYLSVKKQYIYIYIYIYINTTNNRSTKYTILSKSQERKKTSVTGIHRWNHPSLADEKHHPTTSGKK